MGLGPPSPIWVPPPGAVPGSPLLSPPLSGRDIFPLHRLRGPLRSPSSPSLASCPPSALFPQPGVPAAPGEGTGQGQGVPGTGVPPPWQPWRSQDVFLLPILPEGFLVVFPGVCSCPQPCVFPGCPLEQGQQHPGHGNPLGWGPWVGTAGTEVLAALGKPGNFPASHPP